VGVNRRGTLGSAIAAVVLLACCGVAMAKGPQPEFQSAGELARRGDYPKAIAAYEALARSGNESASLYWNWAQVAIARGALGEALWALLRARELDPSDRAVRREIDRLREGANLDRAEIAPDPLSSVARVSRWFRLDLVAILLLAISLGAHAVYKWRRAPARLVSMAWTALALGLVASLLPVAGSFARPTGAVVRRDAPLLDAASPTGETVGTLREGEVVPILDASGGYVRVEDSSGARGWATGADVRPIDAPLRRAS
jgi:tetratricopeptide (TPR) repeat protein